MRSGFRRAGKRMRECDPCGGIGHDPRHEGSCGWCRGAGEVEVEEGSDVDGDEIKFADERDIVRGLGGRL